MESRTFSYFVLCSAVWLACSWSCLPHTKLSLLTHFLAETPSTSLRIHSSSSVGKHPPTKYWMLPTTKVQWSVVATGQHRYPHVSRWQDCQRRGLCWARPTCDTRSVVKGAARWCNCWHQHNQPASPNATTHSFTLCMAFSVVQKHDPL